MNFLFATLIMAVPIAALCMAAHYLVMYATERFISDGDDPKYRRVSKSVFTGLAAVVVVLSTYSNMQAYGPRVTLENNTPTYHPEHTEVESGAAMTQTPEWRGTFDQKLENEPKTLQQEDEADK